MMVCNVFPHVYEALIQEDIDWLIKNTPSEPSLERDHIIDTLNNSARRYREHGYMEAMTGRIKQG